MLYSEFTSIEMTLGRAMETSSGSTGLVFIKVSFIFCFLSEGIKRTRPAVPPKRRKKTPHNGALPRTIVWRKVALK